MSSRCVVVATTELAPLLGFAENVADGDPMVSPSARDRMAR